ncbi:hypothetical protein WA026_007071 [Henosepilachna vigintioctopunctata]|uniref:Uncharacterized protein n=1 Tax=Henosepilachna vigintioctopunctata TaxID=420089 RepID=A0AAW1V1V2_9CUCU
MDEETWCNMRDVSDMDNCTNTARVVPLWQCTHRAKESILTHNSHNNFVISEDGILLSSNDFYLLLKCNRNQTRREMTSL